MADDGKARPHKSRPAHAPRQRRQLHAVVRRPGAWHHGPHPPGTPRRLPDARARDARARPAVVRTHRARDSRARPAVVQDSPGPGLACAPTDRAPTGRHPPGHHGPLPNGPSSQRARHARRAGRLPTIHRRPTICAGKPPNVQLSAAPLAGFWKVEDAGRRQLPGNARAADPWSVRSIGIARAPGGCALSSHQQAEAFCRVNRAQPTNRASGVSCTAWFGCRHSEPINPLNSSISASSVEISASSRSSETKML